METHECTPNINLGDLICLKSIMSFLVSFKSRLQYVSAELNLSVLLNPNRLLIANVFYF